MSSGQAGAHLAPHDTEPRQGSRGPKTPGTVYQSGRKRREEILAAAFEHFAEYGYHGASMREIAASTGVTHAGLRYHFPSKEDLLLAVLEKRSTQGDEFFAGTIALSGDRDSGDHSEFDIWEVISQFITYMRFSFDRPGMIQLFTTQAIAASDPKYPAHEFYKRRYDSMRADYRGALRAIQNAGVLRPEIDIEAAATEIIALSEGLQVQWLLQPEQVNYTATLEHYLTHLVVPEYRERLHQTFVQACDLAE